MIARLAFFFVLVCVLMPAAVHALKLEQVSDVSVRDALVTELPSGVYRLEFELENNDTLPLQEVRFGARLQGEDGSIAYTYSDQKNGVSLRAQSSEIVVMEFTLPMSLPSGTYDVIATAYNRSGSLIASAIVDTITTESTHDAELICEYTQATSAYVCTYAPENAMLSYSITHGGIFGEEVEAGVLHTIADGVAQVDLKLLTGRFGVTVVLADAQGGTLAQESMVYEAPFSWIAVSGLVEQGIVDGIFTADLFLEGVGETDARGFVYALVDGTGSVCVSGTEELPYVVPRKRTVTMRVPEACATPVFAGFLYDGIRDDGTYHVIESFGAVPADTLIAQGVLAPTTLEEFANVLTANPLWVMILVLVGALIVFAIVRSMHAARFGIFALCLLAFGWGVPAHAATFTTADNPNTATFTVNLDNGGVFGSDDDITFTFGIEHNGAKPSGASASVKVDDSGASHTIVEASDTQTSYAVSLNPVSSGGTHTLDFTVPDLCGSAFGYSTFDDAVFGEQDCEFSVEFEVIENTPPGLPQMTGSCTVPGANTFGFSSVDDDQVYYQVRFDSIPPTIRVPSSGYSDPYNTYAYTTYSGWTTQGAKSIRVRAIDTYNERSSWKTFNLTCSAQCAATVTCDGGAADIDFTAQPSLVAPDTSTTLHWTLANVHDCSISGTNGNAWDWSTVSAQTQVETSALTGPTTYTMQCTDFDGEAVQADVTVRFSPQWYEF